MLSFSILLGLTTLASTSPLIARNSTFSYNGTEVTDGHYLDESITTRTFFNGTCTKDNVATRKEWRSLQDDEKKAFIKAELCLMNLPGKTGLPGALTRFDDFQASHQQGTNNTYGDIIHYTPQFLAWHRYQIHAHETVLKEECNYIGTIPWWDEAQDAASGDFFQSDMWEDRWFGGNGSSIDNCVTTGPFANRTLHVGPLESTTDYCFARKWNETKGLDYSARSHVDACYAFGGDEFESFYGCMAYYPHIGGHQATGGVMTDVDSSPGDPLFYLHHTYLDRLWWQWEQIDAAGRMFAMGGNTTVTEPPGGFVEMTIDYEMNMFDIVPNVTIADVVNIQGGYLCYDYEY
ncbi:hypothetical protein Vi05172_g7687 [Venturia inaequalis]|nr:hypothetical protein Vi05172_g7687 [Venturia inaequalis]